MRPCKLHLYCCITILSKRPPSQAAHCQGFCQSRPRTSMACSGAQHLQNAEASIVLEVGATCTMRPKVREGVGGKGGAGNRLTSQLNKGGRPQRRGPSVLPCTVQQRGSNQAGGVGPQGWQEDGAPHHVQSSPSHAAQLAQVLQMGTGQVGAVSRSGVLPAGGQPPGGPGRLCHSAGQGKDWVQHECCTP